MKITNNALLEFLNPKYIYVQITPTFSVRNYKSDDFITMIARLYTSLNDRIDTEKRKLTILNEAKLGYYVYMQKDRNPDLSGAEFYFMIPEAHFKIFEDKIYQTWSNKIDFKTVDGIPNFEPDNCSIYTLTYKKHDAFSLSCDKRDNELLSKQLDTLHIMENGDKVGIFYNFIPMDQRYWKSHWDNTINDLRDGITNIRCETKLWTFVFAIINMIMKLSDSIISGIVGNKETAQRRLPMKDLELSKATIRKRDEYIAKCQILCFSESPDKSRERANALTVCHSFECLSEDNSLVYSKVDKSKNKLINCEDTVVKVAREFCIQGGEGQSFVGVPGRTILEKHPMIKRIESLQCDTPVELRSGVISIGYNEYYNGDIIKSYLPSSFRERLWLLLILGPTRAGKTNLIANITRDATDGGECTILFDFCGHCELSDAVVSVINGKKIVTVDCADIENLPGMGYNEVPLYPENSFKQYEAAKIKAAQLKTLIDSANDEDRELKAKMNKLLHAASLIVFINNGNISEVFRVLMNYNVREKYIRLIPTEQKSNFAEHIENLRELDGKDNNGKPTGESKITPAVSGIMDRLDSLKMNTYMEFMLKKDCSKNINLTEEIQKNQVICLRIPESLFTTQEEKDAFCIYWLTKIWLAVKIRDANLPRDQHVKVNLVVDELSQVPHTEAFLKKILSQMAKFTCKTIISAHYLNQLKTIRQELRSANASIMMLAGCDLENYNEMKHELAPYEADDLLHLKEFTSLNLIKTGNGFVKFITKLPPKLIE